MFTAVITSVALVVTLSGVAGAPVPAYPQNDPALPDVSAETWIVYDETAEVILASWNADEERSMASVTKVMTAMVVLDNADLGERVTVPESATSERGSSSGLVAGEERSVSDLLVAMMVRSGNDAALTLAQHVGDGSPERFVAMMNAKAAELGMTSTSFVNPNGLDEEGHYSTARDLLTMTLASLEYPDIQRMARIRLVKLPADPTGKARHLTNTNHLLGTYPGVVGLKTGDTPWAGKVLIGVAERGPRRLVTVVMGSDDHFGDTRELLDWGYRTYGLRDRLLRPLFSEQGGGGAVGVDMELSEGHQRRLAAMPKLDDGRWNMSRLSELPKAKELGEWLREALPDSIGGDG